MPGRTLTGAWIETTVKDAVARLEAVAPSRVRGLKLDETRNVAGRAKSHPHGCVD